MGQTQKDAVIELAGVRGLVRMRNFTRTNIDTEKGEMVMTGTGNPVSVEDTGTGITLSAQSLSCTLVQNAKGEYVVKQATLSDGAVVLLDTAVAAATAANRARIEGKPAPAKPAEATRTRIASDQMIYVRENEVGTLTLPSAAEFGATTEGTTTRKEGTAMVEVPFTQESHASGSKGKFTLSVPNDPDKEISPLTGHVDGPVKFHMVRTARTTPLPEVSTVDGLSDRFDADFTGTGDPTMVLDGNVKVDGKGTGFNGSVTGQRATITLNRSTNEPKGYEFIGQPATTRIKPTDKKAGGR